jgi:GNAT superfamily N-acetyltransferase
MDNQNTTLFLALWDKEIVWMASILLEYKLIRGWSLVAHIEDVVVHGDHHGKGIWKKLLETMIRHAQTAWAYKIILDCDEKMIDRYRTAWFVEKWVCMRYDISPV